MIHTLEDDDRLKTQPWHRDEYVLVNGYECVYTVRKGTGDMLVHLPGGLGYMVDTLRARGCTVQMPKRLRGQK